MNFKNFKNRMQFFQFLTSATKVTCPRDTGMPHSLIG